MRLALVLHGRLGSWVSSATDLPRAQALNVTASSRQLRSAKQSSERAALRAFAGFTHSSLWRHVVEANRAKGARVRVAVHSWSPEAGDLLDQLYRPVASAHEAPLPNADKVVSQHVSMGRALTLLANAGGPADDLIMVARLDLLLFTDVPMVSLAQPLIATRRHRRRAHRTAKVAGAGVGAGAGADGTSPPQNEGAPIGAAPSADDVLYLPHTCVPSRLRVPSALWALESQVLRHTCSGSRAKGVPTGRRMLPAQLTRYQPGVVRALDVVADLTLFVLDYFFIATPAVAASFGALLDHSDTIESALRNKFHNQPFPRWAHLYWAQHVTGELVPRGVALRFVLLHEADFTLARFWRFGADCVTPTRRGRGSARKGGGDGVGGVGRGGEGSVNGGDGERSESVDEAAWAGFENVTRLAQAERLSRVARHARGGLTVANGGAAAFGDPLRASPLREQCPPHLESGAAVLCPWFSRACAAGASATLAMAEAAGRFQLSAQLPPRQLMGAERCVTPACLAYEGTARKRRRGERGARAGASGVPRRPDARARRTKSATDR